MKLLKINQIYFVKKYIKFNLFLLYKSKYKYKLLDLLYMSKFELSVHLFLK